ncbi:unnamed protein product [Linum tenue]|uniref:non-specific serine/threonine protein kinase n=1 Tax=Linum tenue TaxID=586396 RepID=A0AAV0M2T6_9ROSI|nr:unnamed protein product [Linum tenue]
MPALCCFLFVAMAASFFPSAVSQPNDSQSLLSLKQSISADQSNLLSSWRTGSSDHCSWFAVLCDPLSRRVVSLNFTPPSSYSPLVGLLPDSIGALTALRTLVLSRHRFSGPIPSSISNLRSLRLLDLHANNFSGQIPNQISSLPSLALLNLSFNSFSGQIPSRLIGAGSFAAIDLSNNQLKGEIPIARPLDCSRLIHLKLSNNYLEKMIPPEIGQCSNLRTLLLDGNILQGSIPPELGQISELRVLDLSTNSLTDSIPKELGNCTNLAVLVLTNASNFVVAGDTIGDDSRLEFNAFERGIPHQVLALPSLQILWAPRANLDGTLPSNWTEDSSSSCALRVLQLGQNAFTGILPQGLGACKNLTLLDLSFNNLTGNLPTQLPVSCMVYFNVSQNHLSGILPTFPKGKCDDANMISYGSNLGLEDVQIAYSNIPVWGSQMNALLGGDEGFLIVHDLSWNQLAGSLPAFSIGDGFLAANKKIAYRLLLNNNMFNGSFPADELVSSCDDLFSLSVNLSANVLSCDIQEVKVLNCSKVREFEAAHNQMLGSLTPAIGNMVKLQSIDLRGNSLSGSLPDQFGDLKLLQFMLLGSNNFTGGIPSQWGQMSSLVTLDLSHNLITGSIPQSLANAKHLETVLLNNNGISGEIPSSFSSLSSLKDLDVSFNNLSGPIPPLLYQIDCSQFTGNAYLAKCSEPLASSPQSSVDESQVLQHQNNNRAFIIALVTSVSIILAVSLVVAIWRMYRKRSSSQLSGLRGKVVVTFADAPPELTYDNVLRATGNFSVRNLIGTGGFGATYKAEIVSGYFVAVKRLSIGRIQGSKQFDAEIRTLGRIRHKNLVTLIGYYVGESEMLLIYNYLSGGNLDTFIHDRSGENGQWSVIYKIALDITQALTYLHYSCVPRILHRDIKPSNILLDEELNAYLSDFGLARLLEVSQTHATTDVAGTFGYVAPEYATTCRVSDKSDVYSFGVVMLELMSGKKSLDPSFSEYGNGFNIVAWAKLLIKEGRSSELFSAELWETGPKENLQGMLKLASACTVESLSVRPSMKHVLEKLKQLKY